MYNNRLLVGCVLKSSFTNKRYLILKNIDSKDAFEVMTEKGNSITLWLNEFTMPILFKVDENINKIKLVDSQVSIVNFGNKFYFFNDNLSGGISHLVGSYTYEFLTKVDQLKSNIFCHSVTSKNILASFSVDDKQIILNKSNDQILFDSLCFNTQGFRTVTTFLNLCRFTLKTV